MSALDRVRALFGPTRKELRAEVETWKARRETEAGEKRAAHTRLAAVRMELGQTRHALSLARGQVQSLEGQLRRALVRAELAMEPAQGECVKVRLHHKADAELWREKIAATTKSAVGDLAVYECKTCPRSPVTLHRYWHVGHVDPEAKADSMMRWRAGRRQAVRENRTVGQRIDPAVMEKLRAIGGDR